MQISYDRTTWSVKFFIYISKLIFKKKASIYMHSNSVRGGLFATSSQALHNILVFNFSQYGG